MNHSLGITQRKKSMEEWLIPELKEKDIVKDAIVTRTMKVPAGEFVHIVTKASFCRHKKGNEQNTQQSGRADKVSQKGKKNKKRKAGKRVATVADSNSRRESEEEESEISEEESPIKRDERTQQHKSRSVRLAQYQPLSAVRSLNDQLSNMDDDERKNLKLTGRIKRVNIAKQNDDEAVISSTAYSKMVGGRCTHM